MALHQIMEDVFQTVLQEENKGELASYIPELAKVNGEKFGVFISTIDGQKYGIGDCEEKFSIQSIAKVISLSLAYHLMGESLWSRVGVEPSGTAFNSLIQLESDNGIPRNPFLNGGAMVICDVLMSHYPDIKIKLINFVRSLANNHEIDYCKQTVESEKSIGYRNVALCNFIKSYGNIENEPEDVLDFYFHLCSIRMTCSELSHAFLYLANHGKNYDTDETILNMSQCKRVNAIMQTCGFYDESGEFTFKVGLPGKSGVGGGIVAVYPSKYSIAVWSPKLNKKGNSYRGMKFLEFFTTKEGSSIF